MAIIRHWSVGAGAGRGAGEDPLCPPFEAGDVDGTGLETLA